MRISRWALALLAVGAIAQIVRGPGGGNPGQRFLLPITDVIGLEQDLLSRAKKALGYLPNRAMRTDANGDLAAVIGSDTDCVRVNGTAAACGSGAGSTPDAVGVIGETPGGAVNGSNAVYTLASTPITGTLRLYHNGLRMRPGVDYSLATNTITFVNGRQPQTGDLLVADYQTEAAGVGSLVGESQSVDGEMVLWEGTGGTDFKRASLSGVLVATNGVPSAVPGGPSDCVLVNGTSSACGGGTTVSIENFHLKSGSTYYLPWNLMAATLPSATGQTEITLPTGFSGGGASAISTVSNTRLIRGVGSGSGTDAVYGEHSAIGSNTSLIIASQCNPDLTINAGGGCAWFFLESGTSKLVVLQIGHTVNTAAAGWTTQVKRYTDPDSVSGSAVLNRAFGVAQVVVRLRYDGTNLYFDLSTDGVQFEQAYAEAKAAFFTTDPDRWGAGVKAPGEYGIGVSHRIMSRSAQ